MPVHVDQMSTDVVPEAPPEAPRTGPAACWEELMRFREMESRLLRDRLRTAAEASDD